MSIIFDAHTHISFPVYDHDRDDVIQRVRNAEVKMITVGTNLTTSREAVECAMKYPYDVWATVGFHPSHVAIDQWHHDTNEQRNGEQEQFDRGVLADLAQNKKVVAIGECGLDYFRIGALDVEAQISVKEKQKKVFIEHITLAQECHKPLMIHCRPSKGTDDAYDDLFVILNEVKNLDVSVIIHFFVGSLEMTKRFLSIGCFFTFGGVVTFVRDYDESIREIPLENIMLETDAPYVSPEPYRGKRNEPVYVIEVAKKIAHIKHVGYEVVVEQTTKNARSVFNIL